MRIALLPIVILLLVACQAQPQRPDTVPEALFAAASYGEWLTDVVNNARRSGLMPSDDHQRALDILDEAHGAVQIALVAYETGRPDLAADNLAVAESALRGLLVIVSAYLPAGAQSDAYAVRYGNES